jgi:hypothetical protein
MCASLVCGFLQAAAERTVGGESHVAGSIFLVVFLINIMVISFDFPGIKALAFFLGIIATVLLLLYLNSLKPDLLPFIGKILKAVHAKLSASPAFYWLISAILFIMIFGGVLVNWLWNRWTVEPGQLFHRHGILGELTKYPVIDLQLDKKIEDVFEYALLLSGTLTFKPNPSTPPITLTNVPRINAKEEKIQTIIRQSSMPQQNPQ